MITVYKMTSVISQAQEKLVCREKETKTLFVISSIKLGWFWWNSLHSLLNKLAAKICERFPFHPNKPLHYLVKFEMLIMHMLPLHCQKKKLQNLSHLNCGIQIRQIWSKLITVCWEYCKRRCTKTCHWSGWTETATENGVGQAGSVSYTHLTLPTKRIV